MIIPTIILMVSIALLVYSQDVVGDVESISRLFYHNETRKLFKAAMWLNGGLLIFYDPGNVVLNLGGLALIGVPIFGDFLDKTTRWFHFSLAGLFFIFTSWYISPWLTLAIGAGFASGMKLIPKRKIYWLEVIGLLTLIIGFYFL